MDYRVSHLEALWDPWCGCGMLPLAVLHRDPLGWLVLSGLSERMPGVMAAFLEIFKDMGKKATEKFCFPDYWVHFQTLSDPVFSLA